MSVRLAVRRAAFVLPLCLALPLVANDARADVAAAKACAAQLPTEAKTIFDATLPKMTPGADLRAVVTASTRSLTTSGAIDPAGARPSAIAAAKCLRQAD
ncbi:MAG TPA: hypothetical protein VMF62_20295 [Acetobacteraceae bacterium]|nr:hypothetical protein [Acetobacteraceae bacterium]